MADNPSQVADKGNPAVRKSANLLPVLFRTDKNIKFLAGTLDQLIQTPQLKRLDGWVGSKITPTYNSEKDFYIQSNLKLRQDYQLEPALVVTDDILKIIKSTSYDDLINQLKFEGANVSKLDRVLKPEYYSYDPRIDFDKFTNFEKYYWVPTGPASVAITNTQKEIASTLNVTDTPDGNYFLFTPDGLTPAPQLTLYRGVTYTFNVDSVNNFWIKTARIAGREAPFRVTQNNGSKKGQVVLKIDETTPEKLYYVSETDILNGGEIVVKAIEENSAIDVEKEIIGKVSYKSYSGVQLSNGLKINFVGNVTPAFYEGKEFIVEGVGTAIRLIEFNSLDTPENFADIFDETYGQEGFDEYGFDQGTNLPVKPEYVTINRASNDKNPWSRYNRWFHEDVLTVSATANGAPVALPVNNRAKRPIIEFEPDLQLFNFGSFAKQNIQFIDTTTKDVFSTVQGKISFYVDGEKIGQGDRIIFTADTDTFVNGKTYVVNFIKINDRFVIDLEEADDATPLFGDSISVTKGTNFKGTNWRYDGSAWVFAQQKTVINQAPKFEIFDNNGISYSDTSVYKGVFSGSKVFGYAIGSGANDSVLGFPLSYKNVADQAYYLFKNYFMTDSNLIIDGDINVSVPVASGFVKKNSSRDQSSYVNVWTEAVDYQIPILQYNVISENTTDIQITAVENAGYQDLDIEVFVNEDKKVLSEDYTLVASGRLYFVVFKSTLVSGDRVFFKIKTDATPSETGFYETSIGWANNPLNGPITEFTLSELGDHVKSMVDRHPDFVGAFPGTSNIRDLPRLASYGTRLISNKNPASFAGYFIANDEFNLMSSTRLVGQHYNQFKLGLIDQLSKLSGKYTPIRALDIALYNMNVNKDVTFPYSTSDMLGYGTDAVTREYTVTDSRNVVYSLLANFSMTSLSERSVVVYHTDSTGTLTQLLHGVDYEFDLYDASVHIHKPLVKGDVIRIDDYPSTRGCYVPPTPTKLGLYPKFEPSIFVDDTYVEPQTVIQGHDGSIIIAFGDDRDEALLEFERRVYNNIKVQYNPDIVNIHDVVPGAFRNNRFTLKEVNEILSGEFLKWDAFYGFNFKNNSTAKEHPKTWNFSSGKELVTGLSLTGSWRSIYKHFFDTDRPHTHPWEMLGFSVMPAWWESEYGPAPYTNGNTILWSDLEQGLIKDPAGHKINSRYARPGLSAIIPVDDMGELLDPAGANIATGVNYLLTSANWKFGDYGPVESAWRRSSLYPYAVQILMALTTPATYASLLFDTSRVNINAAGQYCYGDNNDFISFDILKIHQDVVDDAVIHAAGYSVFLVEAGKQRNRNYIAKLKSEIANISFKLSHKVGGFVSQDKLKISIDSISPSSNNPGVSISNEDYHIFLDKSSPVKSIGISGIIVEKTQLGFSVRGYDTRQPYFTCYDPVYTAVDPTITIGGSAEPFVDWVPSSANPMSGLDVTSVSTNSGYRYYKQGQLVRNNSKYYRVKVSHSSGPTFELAKFQPLPALPVIGGVTVKRPGKFETTTTVIPYGTEYSTIEDVFSMIVGYGHWLESQGLVYDEYNAELEEVINWTFSGKEVIYWSTQNWAIGSVITVSPFANTLQFNDNTAVVDDLTNIFYEYSVLKADGAILPKANLSTVREEGVFTLKTVNTTDGVYFIRLNLIQKEHTLILNNATLFNDVIYDVETGYRQRRIKLIGFITDNWNGDIFSPGFIYDEANISSWQQHKDYSASEVVFYAGNYYSAINAVNGSAEFDFNGWSILGEKPVANLLPNFDYKIAQFEDFYSLDIDNFDAGQQALAQHLLGYSPKNYLENIFVNATSQYKFYQGYIKEKGTRNTINKLGKASIISQGSYIDFFEDWAFRVGDFGAFSTDQTLEINLDESKFKENPQIIKFVETESSVSSDFITYKTPNDIIIKPRNYASMPFATTSSIMYDDLGVLPIAGYVRLDDVTATAFNRNSILDIANNRAIGDGDTIWVGFKENGDWDVYRHTMLETKVSDVSIYIPGTSILITTDYHHNLTVGDIVSIVQFDSQIDGVYKVESIPELDQFVVSSVLTSLATPFDPAVGIIFKFISSRIKDFDSAASLSTLGKLVPGDKLWVDDTNVSSDISKWAVYEKVDNFWPSELSPTTDFAVTSNQRFGYTIAGNASGTHFAIASPSFYSSVSTDYGKIYTYRKSGTGTDNVFFSGPITTNKAFTEYFTGTNNAYYGSSLLLDSDTDYVIAGAPYASNIKYTLEEGNFSPVSESTDPASVMFGNYQGIVRLNRINFDTATSIQEAAYASPEPQDNALFGYDLYIGTIDPATKILFASAPGQDANTGAVFCNKLITSLTPTTLYTEALDTPSLVPTSITPNSRFGHSISGNNDATAVVVSAPGWNTSTGAVYVFTSNNQSTYVNSQIIKSSDAEFNNLVSPGDNFGDKVLMTADADYVFIASPKTADKSGGVGKIFVMKWDTETSRYQLNQIISNPYNTNSYEFGSNMSIAPNGKTLLVSSIGSSHKPTTTFDTYTQRLAGTDYVLDPESPKSASLTTFDSDTVTFYSILKNSGTAFTFIRENDKFIFSDELFNSGISANQVYGQGLCVTDNCIVIGAPGQESDATQTGSIFFYDPYETALSSWRVLRQEEELVDLGKVKSIKTIDTEKEAVDDYLEIIDPVKGKISGLADQELRYKSLFDPAVYSLGVAGTAVDTNTNWLDEHVGELWWDLSSVKFVWYEQGEAEFRKNNWNTMFPGSTIDVYEWVRSTYLPSQWSTIADTNSGLSQGMSGQPKFPDNSTMSVKQIWDPISNSFSNVYYYWVKNKITIPEGAERKLSAYNVAALIVDPKSQGVKFASVISRDSLMLTNMQTDIVGTKINLSIDLDTINNINNKHTEWMLVQDGNASSQPPEKLYKKMIHSLLGRDDLGNFVPDLTLPSRLKYGVGIRPRQSMFKDKSAALRVLIEYVNSILLKENIVDTVNLSKFLSKDEIPSTLLGQYDVIVEDLVERDYSVSTRNLKRAELSCYIQHGRIINVDITNKGFGYGALELKTKISNTTDSANWIGPTVVVDGDGFDAVIETEVNSLGEVVKAIIVNPGYGFTEVPSLTVRPFTVIVNVDETVNNVWSRYSWDYTNKVFARQYSQGFDTSKYWKYIDWIDNTYNPAQDIIATIDSPYQLYALTNIPEGNYVKIRNAGDGRYIIIRKIESTRSAGTYNAEYDLIYQENGTIKILDLLWNFDTSIFGFEQTAGWDQTLFDQTPVKETSNIITGILDDIFVNQLKVYKNKLFFKLVKYSLTEQKALDWAFKTSFIDVVNYAGALDQRSVYKLNNESYYQAYISETKPYHTKVRNFTVNYTATDITSSVITDFDAPSVYNAATKQYTPITFGSPELTQYPWKSWADNYGFSVEAIEVYDGGVGYEVPPVIEIIAQPGDIGTGAKAEAYISLGKVTSIIVTDPGSGYTSTPIVNILGGGPTYLIPAKVSIRMSNSKVRSNMIKMKFDRVSGYNEIDSRSAHDLFVATGTTNEFELTWAPNPDKLYITVKVNGIRELSGNYSIKQYTRKYKGYSKKCGTLVLNYVPKLADQVTIDYRKDISLYNAVDRIRDYYEPTAGMPGNTATMLMFGLEYPGVTVDTLPFAVSNGWDTLPFGTNNWDDFIPEPGYYSVKGTNSTSTFTLPYTPEADQRINVYLNSVRVDGVNGLTNTFVGNGFTNNVDIGILTTSTDTVAFRFETSDGSNPVVDPDLDTYISGGGYYTNRNGKLELTKADDLEDIIIDGDNFISTTNSYGPEENLPGRVSDSLGINIYTYPTSGSAMMTNKKYYRDQFVDRYSIGATPPNVDSVEVMMDNRRLVYGTDYSIDFNTNEIVLLDNQYAGVRGPYFSPNDVLPRKENINSPIASTAGDDTYTGPYNLGFEWNMFGTNYTQIYVGTNGYVTFGGGDSQWTPLVLGQLAFPAIYVEYCDLWQGYGTANSNTTPLATGETPGLFLSQGTIGNFQYWRLRFQGTHYNKRGQLPAVPAYQYEVTLYSDGTNQYVEMIYENTWREANFNGDLGFVTGIALARQGTTRGAGILVDDSLITDNSSHVFYSTSNGGNWQYAGRGSFDPFKNQNPQPSVLSITTMAVGGKYFVGKDTFEVSTLTGFNNFELSSNYQDVRTAYVTVNGVKRTNFTIVGCQNNGTSGRAEIVFPSNLTAGNVLQVWSFASTAKTFSEVKEQIFSTSTNAPLTLSAPPGNIAPLHGQVIVEKNGLRLVPPDTLYYSVEFGNRRFELDLRYDWPQGLPDRKTVEVHVNGIRKPFGKTLKLLQDENAIEFTQTAIKDGDVVAITVLRDHDYSIVGDTLVLSDRAAITSTSTVKVTTFNNHDSSLFRRERFPGNYSGIYRLSRPAINDNYVWVEVNGRQLVRNTEYRLDRDKRTLILNSTFKLHRNELVVVMSVGETESDTLIGYRMFVDNLGRTHYKRLSQAGSTQLAGDLTSTSTFITVEDATVLTQPNPSRYRPGVILIDGERIEFFKVEGNRLSSLRRGTLGTGVKALHKESSIVVDQGAAQTIPVVSTNNVWTAKAAFWTTGTNNIEYGTSTWATGLAFHDINKHIKNENNVVLQDIPTYMYEQVEVFYQGRKLRKPLSLTYVATDIGTGRIDVSANTASTYIITDSKIAYDSDETGLANILGTQSNVLLEPEFTITAEGVLTLNTLTTVGSEIKVIKKLSETAEFEYFDAHARKSEQVKFLLESPSFLPDKYYYGQNTTTDQYMILELGDTLDSETGDPLIGQ